MPRCGVERSPFARTIVHRVAAGRAAGLDAMSTPTQTELFTRRGVDRDGDADRCRDCGELVDWTSEGQAYCGRCGSVEPGKLTGSTVRQGSAA